MLSRLKNIYLIVLLAMLQCFAPLLHAHTMGMSHVSGVHAHFDHDMLDLGAAEAGKPEVKITKSEFPAIGVAQEYKKEYVLFAANDQVSPSLNFPVLSVNRNVFAVSGQIYPSILHFYHPLPFAQAPPVFLF